MPLSLRTVRSVLFLLAVLSSRTAAQRPGEGLAGAAPIVLDSAVVRASAARTLAEFLAGRVAGLNVSYATGAAGFAPDVSARGAAGALGSSRPLLFVDGVLQREDAQQLGPEFDRLRPSHPWLLPLDEVESIDVYLGPSSATLGAFGASRGLVSVRTRRPTARRRVTASFDMMRTDAPATLPTRVTVTGTTLAGATEYCPLTDQATGFCTATGTAEFRPYGGVDPFRTALSTRAQMQATGAGAGPLAAYRASAVLDEGAGTIRTTGIQRIDLAFSAVSRPQWGVTFDLDARFARADGAYARWSENGILQTGYLAYSPSDTTVPIIQRNVDSLLARTRPYTSDRVTAGIGARATLPLGLSLLARVSHDRTLRSTAIQEALYSNTTDALVGARDARTDLKQGATSASLALRGARRVFANLSVEAEAGALLENLDQNERSRDDRVVSGDTTLFTANLRPDVRARSVYLASRLSLGAGRSIGGGLRKERTDLSSVKLGADPLVTGDVSWELTRERFLRPSRWLGALRVRAAYGESNDLQPMLEIARFGPSTQVSPNAVPEKFERTMERSFGADLGWLDGALTLSGTGYGRYVRDGLLLVASPDGGDVFGRNAWSTVGEEWTLALRDREWLGARWALRGSFSRTRSKVTRMVEGPSVRALFVAARARFEPGLPFGAVFTSGYTFNDTNGDGIIDVTEIDLDAAATRRGVTQPREVYGLAVDAGWRNGLSVGMALDAKTGQIKIDQTGSLTCVWLVCADLYDRSSLARQARAVVSGYGPGNTGPVFDADFLRVRELWLRYDLPARFVPAALQSARITVAAQHLATWTRYPNGDPETGSFASPTIQRGDIYSPALPRSFTFRLDLVP